MQQRVTSALAPFQRAARVTSVSNPYQVPGQISRNDHVAFATVQFDVPSGKIAGSEVTTLMNDARAASGGSVRFSLGGDLADAAETSGGGSSEGVGLAVAAIVLLIAFGSVLAMGLPIATALAGIGAGLPLIALLGHLFPAPSFAPIIAILIGLGVGVDYALFIVTRFRESLWAGATPEQAAVTSMRTVGRTVLVAGTTCGDRAARAAGAAPVAAQRHRGRRGYRGGHDAGRLGCRIAGDLIHRQLDPPLGWDDPASEEPAPIVQDGALVGWRALVVGGVNIGPGCPCLRRRPRYTGCPGRVHSQWPQPDHAFQ